MKRKPIIILLLTAVLLSALFGCSSEKQVKNTVSQSSALFTVDEANPDWLMIETDYGDIRISRTYEEVIRYEEEHSADSTKYVFYAIPDEDIDIEIYTVIFSLKEPEDKASYIGSFNGKNGERVYASYIMEDNINLGQTDAGIDDLVYAAQETVNDIIHCVEQFPGFE